MKKLLIVFLSVIIVGAADNVTAQESVDDAEKFAKRCLRKVRNRRFRKLKEAYPQAMKNIKAIIANAQKEKFGYDEVAKKAPDWIEMINRLKQFPNHQVENKGEVIKFEIVDYQPVLDTAKMKANEAHYQEGIRIMEEHDKFYKRRKAFYHFQEALDFSDNNKEDIYRRAATIHYDEGMRIYNKADSFNGKLEAEESFQKALAWVTPFKDINEKMAKLYYDEAANRASQIKPKEDVVAKVFEIQSNDNKWEDIAEEFREAMDFYGKTSGWKADYKDATDKMNVLRTRAADYLYAIAQKHENVHEFSNQEWAMKYYKKIDNWIPNYKDADKRAEGAAKRMEINVMFYEQPAFVDPSEAGFTSRGHMQAPFEPEWEHLTINPVENPEYTVEEVGMGFILVREGEKGAYEYEKSKQTETEDVTVYIARKKDPVTGEITEDEKTKAEYNTLKKGQEMFDEDGGISLHKYSGTATYHYPTAIVSVDNIVEIWDLRDPANPVKVGEVTSHFSASDKSSYMTYDGHRRAKPDFHNRYGDLKSKSELVREIHDKVMDEPTVYKNCMKNIRKIIGAKVEYIHF